MLGVPGDSGAAGSGYEPPSTLASIISYAKTFSSFGGVMIWDMSQVWANSGFLDGVSSALGGAPASSPTPTTMVTVITKSTATPTTTATPTSTAGLATQWNQCGGQGWAGPTACVAPYVCTYQSVWYSQCR